MEDPLTSSRSRRKEARDAIAAMLNTVAASVNFNVAVPPEDWVIGQCVVCRLSEQPLSHMISHKMQGGLTCLDWNLRPRYLDTEFPKLAKIVWLGQQCSVNSPCAAAELFKGSRTPQSGFVALPMQCKVCISRGVGHVDTDSWIANYAKFLQTFRKWWTSSKVWHVKSTDIYGSKYIIVFTYYMYSTCVFFTSDSVPRRCVSGDVCSETALLLGVFHCTEGNQ